MIKRTQVKQLFGVAILKEKQTLRAVFVLFGQKRKRDAVLLSQRKRKDELEQIVENHYNGWHTIRYGLYYILQKKGVI